MTILEKISDCEIYLNKLIADSIIEREQFKHHKGSDDVFGCEYNVYDKFVERFTYIKKTYEDVFRKEYNYEDYFSLRQYIVNQEKKYHKYFANSTWGTSCSKCFEVRYACEIRNLLFTLRRK